MRRLVFPVFMLCCMAVFLVGLCLDGRQKARAAGPLGLYGCAKGDDDNFGGYTEVCRVYDPETGKHFIVATVRTVHGAGTSIIGGWQQ